MRRLALVTRHEIAPLVEVAINDSANPWGPAVRPATLTGASIPVTPLAPPDAPEPAAPTGSAAELPALLQEQ